MRRFATFVLVLLTGCASVVGTLTQPSPYIGVKIDAEGASRWSAVDWPTAVWTCCDLPFSAVLDTILLPFTVLVWASEKQESSK